MAAAQAQQWGVVVVSTNADDGTTKVGVFLCKDNTPAVKTLVVNPNNLTGPVDVFTLRTLAAFSKLVKLPKECVDALEAHPGFPAAWEHIKPTFIDDHSRAQLMILSSIKENVQVVYCSIQPMKNLAGAD
jgi:hypothetical protein